MRFDSNLKVASSLKQIAAQKWAAFLVVPIRRKRFHSGIVAVLACKQKLARGASGMTLGHRIESVFDVSSVGIDPFMAALRRCRAIEKV
jgi:hypothetical protein